MCPGTKTLPFPSPPLLFCSPSLPLCQLSHSSAHSRLSSFSSFSFILLERLPFPILLSVSPHLCSLDTARDINPLLYIPRTYSRFSYCDRRARPITAHPLPSHSSRLSSSFSTSSLPALACSNVSVPRFSCLKFRSYPHLACPLEVSLDLSPLKSIPVFVRRRLSFSPRVSFPDALVLPVLHPLPVIYRPSLPPQLPSPRSFFRFSFPACLHPGHSCA